MSRIGKKPVSVPAKVNVSINDRTVTVEGPKGSLSFTHDERIAVSFDEGEKTIGVTASSESREARALWGTTRALLQNMVQGVTEGYERKMELVGVGWGAEVQGQNLKLNVGYASPLMMSIPQGLDVKVEKQLVTITGVDKQAVGQFAASMRASRKPEPYNGKGIKYANEVLRRKQGKQFGS